jgi:outer membrane protein assembly factor BamB
MFSIFEFYIEAQESTLDSWSTFQNDLGNTGYSTSNGPKTNETLWNFKADGYIWSDVAVAGGIVYVGSLDNNVYALNSTTGASIWNYTTGDVAGSFISGIFSSATVADGVVYIGSNDNNVYALNSTTGALIWNYTTGSQVQSNPKVANGVVYIGSNDDNVYALNSTNGDLIWNYTTGDDVISVPAVIDGVVYVGSYDYYVYALNATNGSVLWKFETGGGVESSPTGSLIWSHTTGTDRCVQASPAVAAGMVYVASSYVGALNGNVSALDAVTGDLIWSYTTDGLVVSSPIVANNIIYFGSAYIGELAEEYSEFILTGRRGTVYGLDATTGDLIWSYQTGGAVYSSPAIVNGVLYIGSMDRNVYAFGSSSDNQILNIPASVYYLIALVIIIAIAVTAIILLFRRR